VSWVATAIPLANREGGTRAIVRVDPADAEWALSRPWYFSRRRYAAKRENGKTVHMHTELCPGGEEVDHINGRGWDNRRANLRPCTRAENAQNLPAYGSSPYRGVRRRAGKGRKKVWIAQVHRGGKRVHHSLHYTEEEAAEAAAAARAEHMPFSQEALA
jgi:hypothetical protein